MRGTRFAVVCALALGAAACGPEVSSETSAGTAPLRHPEIGVASARSREPAALSGVDVPEALPPAEPLSPPIAGAVDGERAALEALPWAERIGLEQALAGGDARHLPRMYEAGPVLGAPGAAAVASFSRNGARIAIGGHDVAGSPGLEVFGSRTLAVTLAAVSIGRRGEGGAMHALGSRARPAIVDEEVRTDRGGGVVEWWRSLPSGLEHGVTIAERLGGEGELAVEVEVGGNLSAHALSDDAIALVDASRVRVATYAHLVVLDAVGARVPGHLSVAAARIRIEVDDVGARYPLTIDPLLYVTEEATLLASDGAADDLFGYSVALTADGSRALVGEAFDDTGSGVNAGSVRVFLRTGRTWAEEATLLASSGALGDYFGYSVALTADGSRALVGAYADDTTTGGVDAGSARVFLRTGTSWAEEAMLLAAGGANNDYLGVSVALTADGSRALVGAYRDDDTLGRLDAGSARVFLRTGTTWAEEAMLLAAGGAANDYFGISVALTADGSRALVGAYLDDTGGGANAGSARVFLRTGTSWAQEATLFAAGGAGGDFFGIAVALTADGSRALVGADQENSAGGVDAGSARVFLRTGTSWAEEATLLAAGGDFGDRFGISVALTADGSQALVGAYQEDFGGGLGYPGSARFFLRTDTTWAEEATLLAAGRAEDDQFGISVALTADGSRALVGAFYDDTARGVDAGSARVFSIVRGAANGAPCGTGAECLSDACSDGVCCDAACGGSDPADCQACSAALTGGADGTCAPLSAAVASTVTCRLAAGVCDAAEVCSSSGTCPLDVLMPAATVCRAVRSTCDAAETCTGSSTGCPTDAAAVAGFACRPSTGSCDSAEACDGSSFVCPADARIPLGVSCRPPAGPCDAPEACDGASAACPADAFATAGAVCRASIGPCDVEDRCSGSSAACADVLRTAGTVCAPSLGDVCDTDDVCTGSSANCPPLYLSGVECRVAAGACDSAEVCAGSSASCPPDDVEAAGMVCRASTDVTCDPVESCDGTATACPADITSCLPAPDAGSVDGGPSDGGARDAPAPFDAPASGADAASPPATAGCACRAAGAPAPLPAALALVLAVCRRRGRRR